ncbi:class I SAM-dependent methyltransferase [Octadecabacter ascidiaceicola]|uniref:Demethylmenaquinone methyltransferase n=1 Tax=Octadecabacter ascidiaceicola TaxID=1655543 RepID=A0A238K4J0_9RHOB|nr:class I SAM-dependent methyltransferase [Octadecabacter ascidiaceicola]SMX37314.1 Demethylmenaquinone methyltransferase [Octadecabacter ascidiaceicola]
MSSDPSYDPADVAALFDRCAGNYRWWSNVSSFGFVNRWRRAAVRQLPATHPEVVVDLMAGTGEIWPHVLARFPDAEITAIDISHQMHLHALEVLHSERADKITHLEANALTTPLPDGIADVVVSTFGLKTFNAEQHVILAEQVKRLLKPGGAFSLLEASDPKGWIGRPLFRFYMDHVIPLVEKLFLKGAEDFSMVGPYSKRFGDCESFAQAMRDVGLEVTYHRHFFGCATSVSGRKPVA